MLRESVIILSYDLYSNEELNDNPWLTFCFIQITKKKKLFNIIRGIDIDTVNMLCDLETWKKKLSAI